MQHVSFLSAVLAQSLNFSVISSVCALFEFLVAFEVLFHTFTVILAGLMKIVLTSKV